MDSLPRSAPFALLVRRSWWEELPSNLLPQSLQKVEQKQTALFLPMAQRVVHQMWLDCTALETQWLKLSTGTQVFFLYPNHGGCWGISAIFSEVLLLVSAQPIKLLACSPWSYQSHAFLCNARDDWLMGLCWPAVSGKERQWLTAFQACWGSCVCYLRPQTRYIQI